MKPLEPKRRAPLSARIQLMNVIDAVCDESLEDYEDSQVESTSRPEKSDEELSALKAKLVKVARRYARNRKPKSSVPARAAGPKLVEPQPTEETGIEDVEVTADTSKKPRP